MATFLLTFWSDDDYQYDFFVQTYDQHMMSWIFFRFQANQFWSCFFISPLIKEGETPYSVPENLRILAVWTKFPVHLNLTAVLVGFTLVVLSNYKSLHF